MKIYKVCNYLLYIPDYIPLLWTCHPADFGKWVLFFHLLVEVCLVMAALKNAVLIPINGFKLLQSGWKLPFSGMCIQPINLYLILVL